MEVTGEAVMFDPCEGQGGWSTTDVLLAILAVVLVVTGGMFAAHRIRRRRANMGRFLRRVDFADVKARHEPKKGLRTLVKLRSEARTHYTKGRFDDAAFIEVEKRIAASITLRRLAELDRVVPALPPSLRRRAEELLRDGVVSTAHVADIGKIVAGSRAEKDKREGLVEQFSTWAREDEAPAGPS